MTSNKELDKYLTEGIYQLLMTQLLLSPKSNYNWSYELCPAMNRWELTREPNHFFLIYLN